MHTYIQHFIVTVLLFSVLLQSCGDPNLKMIEPGSASNSGKTAKLRQKGKNANEYAPELESVPKRERTPKVLTEVASATSYASSNKVHGNDRRTSFSPTLARPPGSPAKHLAQVVKYTVGARKPPQKNTNKPRYEVSYKKISISQHTHPQQEAKEWATLTSSCAPKTAPHETGVDHAPQIALKSNVHQNAPYQTFSITASHSTPEPIYTLAQGTQVRFREEGGIWRAQVQDVWGRKQTFPVICAPNQLPDQAIQQLANKTPEQCKYWIHTLETNQPPWAPRIVYVGALGARGGGRGIFVYKCKVCGKQIDPKVPGPQRRPCQTGYAHGDFGPVPSPPFYERSQAHSQQPRTYTSRGSGNSRQREEAELRRRAEEERNRRKKEEEWHAKRARERETIRRWEETQADIWTKEPVLIAIGQELSDVTHSFKQTKASIEGIDSQVIKLKNAVEIQQEQLLKLCAPLEAVQRELLELTELIAVDIKDKVALILEDVLRTCDDLLNPHGDSQSCGHYPLGWSIEAPNTDSNSPFKPSKWHQRPPGSLPPSLPPNGSPKEFYGIALEYITLQGRQVIKLYEQLYEEAKKFSDNCAWFNDKLDELVIADCQTAFWAGPETFFEVTKQYEALDREETLDPTLLQEQLRAISQTFEESLQKIQERALALHKQVQTTPSVLRESFKNYTERVQSLIKKYLDHLATLRNSKVAHRNRTPSPPPATVADVLKMLKKQHQDQQQKLSKKKMIVADLDRMFEEAPEKFQDRPKLRIILGQMRENLQKDQEKFVNLEQEIQTVTVQEHIETIVSVLDNQEASLHEKSQAWTLVQKVLASSERLVQSDNPSDREYFQKVLPTIASSLPSLRAKLKVRIGDLLENYHQEVDLIISTSSKAAFWALTDELEEILEQRAQDPEEDSSERIAAQEALQILQENTRPLREDPCTASKSQQDEQPLPNTDPSTRPPAPDSNLSEEQEVQAPLANTGPVDFSELLRQKEHQIADLDNLLQNNLQVREPEVTADSTNASATPQAFTWPGQQDIPKEQADRKMPATSTANTASRAFKTPSTTNPLEVRTEHKTDATPWCSPVPDTSVVSSVAQAQEDENDHVEEVYTDYPAVHPDASLLQRALQLNEQIEEDRKLPASLNTSSIPAEVDKSVKDYLQTFQKSTPEERTVMQTQGEQLLKSLESLKTTQKESYRRQVETFVTQDIDPTVWNTVFKQQKDTKAQVDTLRDLRSQLVNTLQPTAEVLESAGIQATTNEANEVEYYSSDEDEQPLSSEEMQRRREVFEAVVDGIMEGGPTLGAGAAVKLAGKVPKLVKATKTAGQAVQKVGKAAGAVGGGVGAVKINLKNVKLIKEPYLTQKGINPHTLKQEWLGEKAVLKHFDIYRHSKTGELVIFQKDGKGIPIQTGEFIH